MSKRTEAKSQLNATVGRTNADKVRKDCLRDGLALGEVVNFILEDWFSGWTVAERRNFYLRAGLKRKPTGRNITV